MIELYVYTRSTYESCLRTFHVFSAIYPLNYFKVIIYLRDRVVIDYSAFVNNLLFIVLNCRLRRFPDSVMPREIHPTGLFTYSSNQFGALPVPVMRVMRLLVLPFPAEPQYWIVDR